jgi:fatty acid desaturase
MDTSFSDTIDKAALKPLTQRSDFKGVLHVTGHLVYLAVAAWLVALSTGSLWLVLTWPVYGVGLVFLFAPLHETIHRTAFKARWLNDTVAGLCGAVLVLPPDYFRAFHFTHHRYTQDPERDPELLSPKPASLGAYLIHASGFAYWRAQIPGLFRHAAGRVEETFIAPNQRRAITIEARIYLMFYLSLAAASLALETWAVVVYWIVPVALAQPALRLYLLAEHMGCPMGPDMFRNTRTTRTTWALRALAWNMPYHVEHHAYPGIPFHALPEAHHLLKDRIAVLAPGYLAVHRGIVAGLISVGKR